MSEPVVDPNKATIEEELYKKREKIYVREVHGLFAGLRIAAMLVLLGLYYGLPWLKWDGQQSVCRHGSFISSA